MDFKNYHQDTNNKFINEWASKYTKNIVIYSENHSDSEIRECHRHLSKDSDENGENH
jgi:hypothetical protein